MLSGQLREPHVRTAARADLIALLDDDSSLGVRARIYRTCLDAILDGSLPPGARIPSARRLALDWGVARNTVDDALAQLQAEGWIERRVGDGTRVAHRLRGAQSATRALPPRPPSAFGRAAVAALSRFSRTACRQHAPASVPRPVAFVAGMADLRLFPIDTWRRVAARRARIDGMRALGYPHALGDERLRAAVARHLSATRGLHCDAAQIMICNSAMQAVELIGRVLLERGHPVWVEDPGHLNVRTALATSGARLVFVPVDDHGLVVAAGRARVPRPALIVVTPACAHPTGATMSVSRRIELIRAAEAGGAWILENDYQGEFAHTAKPPAPVARLDGGERTLCVGTFSHSLFPSLRLAWCVLPRALVPVFEAVRRQLDDHTHGPLQGVLADFIDGGHLAAHLRRMRASYTARRGALAQACAELLPATVRLGPLEAGMTAALRLPPRWRDAALAARCAAADLPTLPLSRYASVARVNGLLLGYAALDEDDIRAGVARLATILRAARA